MLFLLNNTTVSDLNAQAMNRSEELPSQQVDDVVYVAVHLQPMALQAIWLEKIKCRNKLSYQTLGEFKHYLVQWNL